MTTNTLENLLQNRNTIGRIPFDGRGFYPSRGNRYAIYSVTVDRFILVDDKDLWITFHTAKILSSKLPTAVFALDKDSPTFENEDALFWTTTNKNIIQSDSQCPTIDKLVGSNSIIREGPPIDYVNTEQLEMLITLQDYALFVNKVLYSIRIADAMYNSEDHSFFAGLVGDEIRQHFQIRPDQTPVDVGYRLATEQILYNSTSIEEAMEQINKLWYRRNRVDNEFRVEFFKGLCVEQPPLPIINLPTI